MVIESLQRELVGSSFIEYWYELVLLYEYRFLKACLFVRGFQGLVDLIQRQSSLNVVLILFQIICLTAHYGCSGE